MPSAIFAEVTAPSARSPVAIVPSAIMADVTPPVAISMTPGVDSVRPEPAVIALAALNAAYVTFVVPIVIADVLEQTYPYPELTVPSSTSVKSPPANSPLGVLSASVALVHEPAATT